MKSLYALTDAQHATVLAALRQYQAHLEDFEEIPPAVADIATNCGTVEPLTASEVGYLCEDLNHKGLEFGDVVNLLGDGADDPYVAAAHEHRLQQEGTLEVDPKAVVSRGSDDGAYVMAWLWISNEDAGIAPGEENDE